MTSEPDRHDFFQASSSLRLQGKDFWGQGDEATGMYKYKCSYCATEYEFNAFSVVNAWEKLVDHRCYVDPSKVHEHIFGRHTFSFPAREMCEVLQTCFYMTKFQIHDNFDFDLAQGSYNEEITIQGEVFNISIEIHPCNCNSGDCNE